MIEDNKLYTPPENERPSGSGGRVEPDFPGTYAHRAGAEGGGSPDGSSVPEGKFALYDSGAGSGGISSYDPSGRDSGGGDYPENGRYLREGERGGIWLTLSRVISTVMSPLIMPLIAVMALLYGNTILGYIPGRMKIYFTLVILLNTYVVPMLCIGLLHSMGIIKGLLLGERRDRVLPLMITALCYVLCAFMVRGMLGGYLLGKFLFAGAACITLAFMVTFYWKISIHMLASGGTLAMLLLIDISGIADFFPAVVAMIAGCGALASARMYLGAHTPAQVAAGFTGGFLVAMTVILL